MPFDLTFINSKHYQWKHSGHNEHMQSSHYERLGSIACKVGLDNSAGNDALVNVTNHRPESHQCNELQLTHKLAARTSGYTIGECAII